MPKRYDIENILIVGAGPIVIGQACEFDYSGSQGCKALKEEGYKVILLNSNPATIMTDPDFADVTYVEPITSEVVENIIQKERIDAILPTLGGQTALNCVSALYEEGLLKKYRIKLLGVSYDAIKKAEDRKLFRDAMVRIGVDVPKSGIAETVEEGKNLAKEINFPLIIRPSYTLGGLGGSIANSMEEFLPLVENGLEQSRINQVLIEESLVGWKEYELEIMRDRMDNVVIICSIENIDPMGVHTGDSITVAPAQTLTDREYQNMRNMAIAVIREIGVDTGGSNVQFAVNPKTGRVIVIEINPRVSRSSALASKATGFPIAKIAAKLAVGYTLNELPNHITRKTPASFEPSIDYCVVKIPRFAFEKFPGANEVLGVSMQSIGEVMSIARTFKESLQKGIQSMEQDLDLGDLRVQSPTKEELIQKLKVPNPDRIFFMYIALYQGMGIEELFNLTSIDPWFLDNILQLVEVEKKLEKGSIRELSQKKLRRVKELGFSDQRLAKWEGISKKEMRQHRISLGVLPSYKSVDTCAAEFKAYTPYYYSTYEENDEVEVQNTQKVMILGSGPNRIGQGIEFDYCCCQASFSLKSMGIESIMVNCNPETVSTDYDTSSRLYFEPLTFEHVMNILEKEKPLGVILQFGGQTPLKLAKRLYESGVPILGSSYDTIDIAEDRKRFSQLINDIGLRQPRSGASFSEEEALKIAEEIGYPILVRPSYVLGGRAMETISTPNELQDFMREVVNKNLQYPILIDQFLDNAIEVDVDAICDGSNCCVAGIMEHIEKAGVHSGDSSCSLPPFSLDKEVIDELSVLTKKLAIGLKVKGLLNIQFALIGSAIYVLEVNPRASRTIPFVSKATGISWAKLATEVCLGKSVADLGVSDQTTHSHFSVKEVVFPFDRILGSEIDIGVEMHSTGETMGIGNTFLEAYSKAQMAAFQLGNGTTNRFYVELRKQDHRASISLLKEFVSMGYEMVTDSDSSNIFENLGIKCHVLEGDSKAKWDEMQIMLEEGILSFVVMTSTVNQDNKQSSFRREVNARGIPFFTTLEEAQMYGTTLEFLQKYQLSTYPLQKLNLKE